MGFDPAQPPPRWGMPDILLGLLAWLLLQIVGLVALSLVTSDKAVLSIGGLAASWVGMVGYLVLVSRRTGFGSLRVDFGFRFRWFDPFLGFGIGLGTLFASGIVRIVIAQLFDEAPEGNAERIFGAVQDNKVALVVLALMAAIGAPLVEELFFRGLTLRAIERRLGGVAGVLGSSVVFAVLHFQGGTTASVLGLFLGILIYGLVFAVTTRLTRRLGPSVFAHMTINGLAAAVLIYSTFSGTPLGG
jgi:membrane protease YdiL (CAAX protease family)